MPGIKFGLWRGLHILCLTMKGKARCMDHRLMMTSVVVALASPPLDSRPTMH